jgi:hypothetical protein
LMMHVGGNLVLSQGSKVLWSSKTAGHKGAVLTLGGDGNLVIHVGTNPVWTSNTASFAGDFLKLQDDNNLVIYQGNHPLWDWASGYMGDTLLDGTTLTAGEALVSDSHAYNLVMQADGNLVLYQGALQAGTPLWSSGTDGDKGAVLTLGGDGNLVIHVGTNPVWTSNTANFAGDFLKLQDDNNLVIYQGSTAIWDWASGLLSGNPPTAPTAAETSAVSWAIAQIGQTSDGGTPWADLCLPFVQDSYQEGTGPHINIQSRAQPVGGWNSNTDPQDVWQGTFSTGTTGSSSTTPPYGALVFFDANSGYNPEDYSHVEIMGADGEMIGTPGTAGDPVFEETLAKHAKAGDYNTYVGWWLPDGS